MSSTTEEKIDEILLTLNSKAADARASCTERKNWEDYNSKYDKFESEAKQALLSLVAEERLDELSELWASGTSKFADIQTGFTKGRDIYERRAELRALSTKQEINHDR